MFGRAPRESVQPRPIAAKYIPQPDITAYELALIVQNLQFGVPGNAGSVIFSPSQWDGLDASVKRHFQAF